MNEEELRKSKSKKSKFSKKKDSNEMLYEIHILLIVLT